jgi:hypothetical protein
MSLTLLVSLFTPGVARAESNDTSLNELNSINEDILVEKEDNNTYSLIDKESGET